MARARAGWLGWFEFATLLARLPAPPAGARVVDLARGTGQPALVLARNRPDLQVTGVDAAPAMVERARGKAAGEHLDRVKGDR
jgi:ubiquinone/menaquinone biosynthesis C-methylase UbiE